jgi:hypothetical protein
MSDIAFGAVVYRQTVFQLPGMLPSGCLLTLALNSFRSMMMMAAWHCHVDSQLPSPVNLKAAFFGDDQVLMARYADVQRMLDAGIRPGNYAAFVRCRFGVVLTSDAKTADFTWDDIHEVPFCGRVLAPDGSAMLLQVPRIVKMVQFTQPNRAFEFFPGRSRVTSQRPAATQIPCASASWTTCAGKTIDFPTTLISWKLPSRMYNWVRLSG